MLNKGTSLVESLFAFSIYVTIIILFISLYTQLLKQQSQLENFLIEENNKRVQIESQIQGDDLLSMLEMVLH